MRSTRRTAIAAIVSTMALTVSACSGSDGDSGESAETLTLISQYADGDAADIFNAQLEAFTAETGIEVDADTAGADIATIIETSVAAGDEPDIIVTNPSGNQVGWVDNGVTVDVAEYFDEWGLTDAVREQALTEWTRPSGKVMGFPFEGFQWPVWWNIAVLESAGLAQPPQTTDELIELAGALDGSGTAAVAIGGNDWTGQKLFTQIAQSYLEPDAADKLFAEGGWCASEDGLRGIELLTQLRDAGVFIADAEGYTNETMTTAFFEGRAAGMPSISAFESAPANAADQYVLGGFPVPAGGTYSKPTAFQGYTSTGFMVSENGAEKLDAVEQFVKFMYEPAVVKQFVENASVVTALNVEESDISGADPMLADALTGLADRVDYAAFPDLYIPAELGAQFTSTGTVTAWARGTTPQQICSAIDSVYGR